MKFCKKFILKSLKKFILLAAVPAFVLGMTGCASDEIIPMDDKDAMEKIDWQNITYLDELKGTWISEDKTIIFPFTADKTDYMLIRFNTTNDSAQWVKYALSKHVSLKDVWQKRFAAIAEIYGVRYPIADSNGTQKGVKVRCVEIRNDYDGHFESNVEYLIPETILEKNLLIFKKSPDGKYLRESGVFRFYSNLFKNESTELRYYINNKEVESK